MSYTIRSKPAYPIRLDWACRYCGDEIEVYGAGNRGVYLWRHVETGQGTCPPIVAYRAYPQDIVTATAALDALRDGA